MTHCCMNSICPVCGELVQGDMPPLSFHPENEGTHSTNDEGTFRVCSLPCAIQARIDPMRYHAAACTNIRSTPTLPTPFDDNAPSRR